MQACITVYCRRAEVRPDPAALLREIGATDLMALAETLDLPGGEWDAVNGVRAHLRVASISEDVLELHWQPDGQPLRIEATHGEAATALVEALLHEEPSTKRAKRAAKRGAKGAERVHAHLAETRSVVSLQLDVADSRHVGGILAEVVALAIAAAGDGLVRFYRRDWAAPGSPPVTIWMQ